MTLDLVQLRAWSVRVCRVDSTDPLRVVGALRVGASPRAYVGGLVGAVEPPPAGTSRCEVGITQGRFRTLALTFARPEITRADLDDAFGTGTVLRRVRPLEGHRVAYRVVVPGAPYTCDVIACFDRAPRGQAVATEMVLRRRRAVHRVA